MENIRTTAGDKPRMTLYEDFSDADRFGIVAIKDTYCSAFNRWQNSIEYMTELVKVLGWKIAEHYSDYSTEYRELYYELWQKAGSWVCYHFDGDDLQYFWRTIR